VVWGSPLRSPFCDDANNNLWQIFVLVKSQLAECRLTGVVLVCDQTDDLFTNTQTQSLFFLSTQTSVRIEIIVKDDD